MSDPRLISIESVTRTRQQADGEPVTILDAVNLEVEVGDVIALIGPSGSGKSSLLRLLNRLDEPEQGMIFFSGQPLSGFDPLDLRRQIGLVPQKPFMFPGSVRDNLIFALKEHHVPFPDERDLQKVLDVCAIDPDWLDQPAKKLSVGQQQRVSLARTLLNKPKLLLVDEPTSSLDPETAEKVLSGLTAHYRQNGGSVLMVTHDHSLARRFAKRILELRNAQLFEIGRGNDHAES